jgi:F1F0 ATPase subunit 2
MTDVTLMLLVGIAGFALGVFFFGGLWWTVQKGAVSTRPALLFFGSLLLRMPIALAGLYFLSGGEWQRAAVCLGGFMLARFCVMRVTRVEEHEQLQLDKGTHHAP